MKKYDVDELAEYLIKGCIIMYETLEDKHNAEPLISMTAETDRGKYTVKITREDKE